MQYLITYTEPEGSRPEGMMYVKHKQGCVITNLFSCFGNYAHGWDQYCNIGCCSVAAVSNLWVVLGSVDIEKFREMPGGLYSSQAVSDIYKRHGDR